MSSGLFYASLGVTQPYLYEISSLISTVIAAVSEKKKLSLENKQLAVLSLVFSYNIFPLLYVEVIS